MTSLASKKKKVHRTLITELNKRFPTVEPTGSPPSLNQISLNYSQANNQNDQNNLSTTTKTILEEEGIIEKVIAFQNSAEQRKKFWPDSSFNSLEHLNGSINKSSNQKNNSQVQLINECIKNKDKWVDVKSISREIEENMNKNLEKIKNETDSKKSSIYCSEKINEVESENEEEEKKISFNLKEALEGNLKEALEDNLKSASKINNGSKSSFYSRSKTEKNKENATNNEGSVIETEKVFSFFLIYNKNKKCFKIIIAASKA